jgi:hypothetical protein
MLPHMWGRQLPTCVCMVGLQDTKACTDIGTHPQGEWASHSMSAPHTATGDGDGPRDYEVRLQGHLDDRWADWLGGLTLTRTDDGETRLRGPVADQAALHGLLRNVRDLGLPLLLIRQVEPQPASGPGGDADGAPSDSTQEMTI